MSTNDPNAKNYQIRESTDSNAYKRYAEARIRELKEEIRQAYYEGWGDAIREVGEDFFYTDMQNNWLESDAIKATESLGEGG